MRISDWSSDVCSSDLCTRAPASMVASASTTASVRVASSPIDRKSVVSGKSVSVRVDLGGRRFIEKQNKRPDRDKTEESITSYTETKNKHLSGKRAIRDERLMYS